MRLLKAGIVGLVLSMAATPGFAQLNAARPSDIAEAAASCFAAAGPNTVDLARLTADGWLLATVSEKGKPVETPLRVYSRKQSAAVLMTTIGTGADGLCVAIGRIDTPKRFSDVEKALGDRLGAKPIQRKAGETIFVSNDKMVSLTLSGKSDQPSTRISVMQMAQETK